MVLEGELSYIAMDPQNSSHSPPPPSPSTEGNDNLAELQTEPQQQNLERSSPWESNQQVYVTNGGGVVRPLICSSSDNLERAKRARFTQTDNSAAQPQLSEQKQGMQQNNQYLQQRSNFLPQGVQQSQRSQPLSTHPMQQSQRSELFLQPPMQQSQRLQSLFPLVMQQSQPSQPLLPHPMKRILPPPARNSQTPPPQSLQSMQQNQLANSQRQQQQQPIMMPRRTQLSNIGVADRRSFYLNFLTEVMHYQWARPRNNTVEFWRQYVAKYFDSQAMERWCLSMCNDKRIPARTDGKSCTLCGWRPKRGYEVSFEDLPERFKRKFDRIISEKLIPGRAEEHISKTGEIVLLYTQSIQQSMYDQECVVCKGTFRLVLTNQMKILAWEFCACDRQILARAQLSCSSSSKNWLGIGEIFRRPVESPEENVQGNNYMVQGLPEAWPRVDKNVIPRPGVMQQASFEERQNKQHTTMNGTRVIHTSPTSHGSSNQYGVIAGQNADQMFREPVSVDVNDSQNAGSLYATMQKCLLGNAAALLRRHNSREQMISHNTMNNLQIVAKDTGQSSHMIVSGQNANGISGNGIAGFMMASQTIATLPVESLEAGLIPDPAMKLQMQEIPVMKNPASAQSLTSKDTMNDAMDNSWMVRNDLHMDNQLNDYETDMFNNYISNGDDRTEAIALADEDTYLDDNLSAEFRTRD